MIRRVIEGLNAIFADRESRVREGQLAEENAWLQEARASNLTEACRLVLRNSAKPLTAHEAAALLRSRQAIDQQHLERRVALIC